MSTRVPGLYQTAKTASLYQLSVYFRKSTDKEIQNRFISFNKTFVN